MMSVHDQTDGRMRVHEQPGYAEAVFAAPDGFSEWLRSHSSWVAANQRARNRPVLASRISRSRGGAG